MYRLLDTYYVHFSSEQGEHLRVTLLLTTDAETAKSRLESKLTSFLLNQLSPKREIRLPVDALFMDFPCNSYYYNIFKPYPTVSGCLNYAETKKARAQISKLIAEELCRTSVDQESTFTFLLYMNLALIRIFETQANAEQAIAKLHDEFMALFPPAEQVYISHKASVIFNANRTDLQHLMVSSFFGKYELSSDFNWMASWINTTLSIAERKDKLALFQDISHLLKEHVNFGSRNWEAVILQVIYLTLSSHHTQAVNMTNHTEH